MAIVYEISRFKYMIDFLLSTIVPLIIGLFLVLIAVIVVCKNLKRNQHSDFLSLVKKQVKHPKLMFSILVVLISAQFVALAFFYVNSTISDVDCISDYYSGNYYIASGEVQQYSPYQGNGDEVLYPYYGKHETFYVDGVFFALIDGVSVGYDIPAVDGGYITENGQKVEITYITDENGFNHIMKIKLEDGN